MMIVSRQAVLVFLSWCFLLVPTRSVLGSIFSFGSPSDNNHHDIVSALLHRMKTLEAKVDRMETLQVQVAELNQKVEIQQELIESLETLITTGSRMLNFDEECYFTFFNETGTPTCLANYHLTAGKKKKKKKKKNNSQMSSPPPSLLIVVIFMLVIASVVSPVYIVPPEHGLDVMGNATFDGGSTTFKNETSFVGKGEHVVSFSSDTGTTFYGPVVFDNRTTFERPARFNDNVEWQDKVKFYDDVTFGDSADVFFHDTVTFYDDVTIDGPGRYGKIRFTVKDRVDVEFKQRLDMTVNTETKFYKDVSIKQESCKGDGSNSGRGKGYGGCNYRPPIPDLYVDGDITGDSDLILKEGKVQVNKISPVGSSSYNKVVVDGDLQVNSLESTTNIDADGTITGDAVIATGSGNSLRRRRAVSEEFEENQETKRTLQTSRTVITGNGIVTGGNINTTQNIYANGNIEAGGAISPAFDPASLSRQTLQVAGLVATGTITGMTLVATNGTTRRRATESEDEVRRELQTTAPETTITADGIVATTISARENVRVGDGGIYTTGNINTTENVYATGNVVAGGSLSPAFDLTSLQGQTIEVAGLIATGSITLAASGARRRRRATETEETNDTRELQTTAETTITAEGIKTTGNITIESSAGGATTVLGSGGFDLSNQDVTVKSLVSTSSITASGAIVAGTTVTAEGNITSTGGSVSPVEVNDVMGLELDGFVSAEVLDAASLDTVTIQRLLQGADLELGGLTTTSFSTDDMNSTAVLTALEGVDLFVGSLTANTVSATTSLNAALDTGDIVSALVGSDLSVGSLTAEGNITSTNGLVSRVDVTDVIGLDSSGTTGSFVDSASVTADVLAAMATADVNVGSLTTSGLVSAGSLSTSTFTGDSTTEALVVALASSDLSVGSLTAEGNITSINGLVSRVDVSDVIGLDLSSVTGSVVDTASLTADVIAAMASENVNVGSLTTSGLVTAGSISTSTFSDDNTIEALVAALAGTELSVASLLAEGNITSTNGLVSKVDVTDVIGLDLSGVAGSVVDTASVTADVLAAMASASVNVGSLTTSGAVSAGSISATSVSTTTFSGDSTSEALVAALAGSDLLVGSLTSEGNITSTNGLVSRVDVTDVVGLDLDDLTGSGVDTASVTADVLEAMASTDVNVGSLTTTGSISAGSVSTSSFAGDSTSGALVAALAGMDLSVLSLTADLDITSTNGRVSPVDVNDVIGLDLTTIVSPTLSMSDVVEVLRGASLEVETLTASSVNADTVTATTSLDATLDSRDILAALEGADVRVGRLTASQEIVVTFEDDLGIVGTAFSVDSGGAFIRTSLAVGSDISIGSDLSVIGDAMISGDISANNFGGAVEDDQQ